MSSEIWKDIPFYSRYQASSLGRIRHKKNGIVAQRESPTTKGSYKNVNIKRDDTKRVDSGVHRLVCMAFHGVHPKYPRIETNHRDGDKHNNTATNLHWSTRSDNVKHAYATGLNIHCTRGRILDLETKTEHKFATAEDVGRFFNIPNNEGRDLIRHYQKKPYLGRYLIRISEYKVPEFERNVGVYMVDFVNNKFIQTKTITQMTYLTGFSSGAIAVRLRGKLTTLLNGCYFGSPDDPLVFEKLKNYTPADVTASVTAYAEQGGVFKTKRSSGWKVKDYVKNQILGFKTLKEAAAYIGCGRGRLDGYINNGKNHLIKGCVLKKETDATTFPEYSETLVKISLKHQVANGQPIKVTDLNSNTTEYYGNLSIFAKQIGEDPESFRHKLKNGRVTQYKIEYVT